MKQMRISRDKERRLNKVTVKQVGMSIDKKRRLNKKTVKAMRISRDKERRLNKKEQSRIKKKQNDLKHHRNNPAPSL